MTALKAVREIMKLKGVRSSTLCARLGVGASTISERFRQTRISTEKLHEMLRALDYKIVLMPRETKIPEGGFEVE